MGSRTRELGTFPQELGTVSEERHNVSEVPTTPIAKLNLIAKRRVIVVCPAGCETGVDAGEALEMGRAGRASPLFLAVVCVGGRCARRMEQQDQAKW